MVMDDTIPQTGQSWEGIPFPPSSSSLSSQVQTGRQVRSILVFHIPPASKIQNSRALQWIFPRSELMFSSLSSIPAREEPHSVLGFSGLRTDQQNSDAQESP